MIQKLKSIEFELYAEGAKICSATNTETNYRIARTPARILKILADNIGDTQDKGKLVTELWGKDNYFIRRTFDVHLSKVKLLLKGTYYKIVVDRGQLGLYKQSKKNK